MFAAEGPRSLHLCAFGWPFLARPFERLRLSDACFAGLDLAVLTLEIVLTGLAACRSVGWRAKRVHVCTDIGFLQHSSQTRLNLCAMEPVRLLCLRRAAPMPKCPPQRSRRNIYPPQIPSFESIQGQEEQRSKLLQRTLFAKAAWRSIRSPQGLWRTTTSRPFHRNATRGDNGSHLQPNQRYTGADAVVSRKGRGRTCR